MAAATKAMHLREFWIVLETVPLLPERLIVPVSGAIVAVEALVSVGLLIRTTRRIAAWGAVGLFACFAAYSAFRIATGQTGSCGCFSGLLNLTSVQDLLLDLPLLGCSLWLCAAPRRGVPAATEGSGATRFRRSLSARESESALLVAGLIVAGLLFGYTQARRHAADVPPSVAVEPRVLVPAGARFEGDPHGAVTLVVFMDYECPPCRRTHERIDALLANHPRGLRVLYRNLPLVSIHHAAYDAAIAAESAKLQGRYWEVHRALLKADFATTTVARVVRQVRLDAPTPEAVRRAAATVRKDQDLAQKLKLSGTPSLLVCLSDGKVRMLREIDQLEGLL